MSGVGSESVGDVVALPGSSRAHTKRQPQIVVPAGAAFVTAAVVAGIVASSNHVSSPVALAALTLITSWSFTAAGAFAWPLRSGNRIAVLMFAMAFVVLIRPLQAADMPAIFIVGVAGNHLVAVVLGHLLMIYPSGRFETKSELGLVLLGYFDALVLALLAVLLLDTQSHCSTCPQNPLSISASADAFNAVSVFRLVLDGVLTTGLAVAMTRRWYGAVPSQRAIMAPIVAAGAVAFGVFATVFVSEAAGASAEIVQSLDLALLVACAAVPYAYLFAMIRGRFTRAGSVNDLVATLADDRRLNGDLRDALSVALGDPSLELAYWLPARRQYVDSEGHCVELPREASTRVSYQVQHNGELIAAVVHDKSIDDHPELIRAAAGAAALWLENERLEAELRAHVIELRRSRARLVDATDAERRRIERDLHDGAQQQLISIAVKLGRLRRRIADKSTDGTALLDEAVSDLMQAADELRQLAIGVHPAAVSDLGVSAVLSELAVRAPLPVNVTTAPDRRFAPQVESTVYFVVSEALTNVAKHAKATRAAVSVVERDGMLVVEVRDDGVGGADVCAGTGLAGLADRAAALDGYFKVSSEVGQGTLVHASFNCVVMAIPLSERTNSGK